ncbi:MAG: acyltransferase [Deltaproteobacteria bacterium]|nr:acyltransferase [Deltaproteobacteria bacterium]
MLLQSIATYVRRAETPLSHHLKCWAKAVLRLEIPAPKLFFLPLYRIYQASLAGVSHFLRVFYFQPMFRARCSVVGSSLYLYQGIPYLSGDLRLEIGDKCKISGVTSFVAGHVRSAPLLKIGNHSNIGPGVVISVCDKVEIGNYVRIGTGVRISDNHGHPMDATQRRTQPVDVENVASVQISDDVWLGSGVTILPGVHIGEGAVVGAASVVTKSLPAFSRAAGNPARVLPSKAG